MASRVGLPGEALVMAFEMRVLPGLALLLLALAVAIGAARAEDRQRAPRPDKACVLIDTDVDIDDLMAIPMILQNRHVAAIVTTEGATTPALGASALVRVLAEPGLGVRVPVIVGASPDPARGYTPPVWLAAIRATMERANGFLPASVPPGATGGSFEAAVALSLRGCRHVSLLVIGPWTSFVRYSPLLAGRIDRIVAQGRPTHSAAEGTNVKTFNCAYDVPSCETAFTQTAKLHPVWVDVPKTAQPAYVPTIDMVDAIRPDGLPGSLKAALMATPSTWRADKLDHSNGQSYLWDQLAGLYLLRPELFHLVGAHMEPAVPALDVQRIWTEATNGR